MGKRVALPVSESLPLDDPARGEPRPAAAADGELADPLSATQASWWSPITSCTSLARRTNLVPRFPSTGSPSSAA